MEKDGIVHLLSSLFAVAAGVAIIAVLVSKQANTASVFQSLFSGYGNILATAESPVSGASVTVNNSYPNQ